MIKNKISVLREECSVEKEPAISIKSAVPNQRLDTIAVFISLHSTGVHEIVCRDAGQQNDKGRTQTSNWPSKQL